MSHFLSTFARRLTTHPQFAPRPRGYVCGSNSADKIKNYCDSTDPYCCTGNDANSHQQYGTKYGQQALTFVKSKLSTSGGGGSQTTPSTPQPTGGNGGGNTGNVSSVLCHYLTKFLC
jgi:acetylxylan esterase